MNKLIKPLVEKVDEDVLERMPEWFRILREAYLEAMD